MSKKVTQRMGENIWKSHLQKEPIPRVHRELPDATVATAAKFKTGYSLEQTFSKENHQRTHEKKLDITNHWGNSIFSPSRWLPGQRIGRVGKDGMLEPLCTIIGNATHYCRWRKYRCTASKRVNTEVGCAHSHENWTHSLKTPFVFLVIATLFMTAEVKNTCLLVSCRIATIEKWLIKQSDCSPIFLPLSTLLLELVLCSHTAFAPPLYLEWTCLLCSGAQQQFPLKTLGALPKNSTP